MFCTNDLLDIMNENLILRITNTLERGYRI